MPLKSFLWFFYLSYSSLLCFIFSLTFPLWTFKNNSLNYLCSIFGASFLYVLINPFTFIGFNRINIIKDFINSLKNRCGNNSVFNNSATLHKNLFKMCGLRLARSDLYISLMQSINSFSTNLFLKKTWQKSEAS